MKIRHIIRYHIIHVIHAIHIYICISYLTNFLPGCLHF